MRIKDAAGMAAALALVSGCMAFFMATRLYTRTDGWQFTSLLFYGWIFLFLAFSFAVWLSRR